ncbi:hypothetical protein MTR_0047s0100 [Medicago truncatula]|uniref:Uncharacterized protein n=1 Tax=Medicago truncatula TaxID=3880 RepID=A0A072TI31_MEDTR|nr:hypothetical protein MTR_0047s0100 [Medicago truncatula]
MAITSIDSKLEVTNGNCISEIAGDNGRSEIAEDDLSNNKSKERLGKGIRMFSRDWKKGQKNLGFKGWVKNDEKETSEKRIPLIEDGEEGFQVGECRTMVNRISYSIDGRVHDSEWRLVVLGMERPCEVRVR